MEKGRKTAVLKGLKERIQNLERLGGARRKDRPGEIPFGIAALDSLWPEGGLPAAALHEVAGDNISGTAAATAFTAAIAGRLEGMVLWCATAPDFYGPGLAQVGLPPERLLTVRPRSEKEVLAVMEEGLRHSALRGVIGEVSRLDLTASRRLQLAAEKSGVTAFVLRKPLKATTIVPIAATSRWRVSAAPSGPHLLPHTNLMAGRARWKLELLRSRSGTTGCWIVEAPDAQGYLHLSSALADRSEAAPVPTRHLAAG